MDNPRIFLNDFQKRTAEKRAELQPQMEEFVVADIVTQLDGLTKAVMQMPPSPRMKSIAKILIRGLEDIADVVAGEPVKEVDNGARQEVAHEARPEQGNEVNA